MKKPKIILLDIETFPLLSYTWGIYDQNVIKVKKEWELASFAYKDLGSSVVHCLTRSDFKDKTDKSLVKKLRDVLDSADIVIAHNGDKFDIKKSHTRIIKHKISLPSTFSQVDTLKMARAKFSFTSNRLDDLGEFLGLGRKVKHEGFGLWEKCQEGNKTAWAKMRKYNKQDVVLLEKVYLALRPWAAHPNTALMSGNERACPRCGSERLKSKGWHHNKTISYRRLLCLGCGGYVRSNEKAKSKPKYRAV